MNISSKLLTRSSVTQQLNLTSKSSTKCHHLSSKPFQYSVPDQRRNYASGPEMHSPTQPPTNILPPKKRIVVAMTGATGAILGVKTLKALKRLGVETHLIISKWAEATIKYETDFSPLEIRAMADFSYSIKDQSAPMSSGSFSHNGMIVVPCTMKTLAGIRIGYSDDLISRAADVTLKERRKLVLVTRETPLSDIHLENMLSVTRSGATIFPPVPAFYIRPESVGDLEDQSVGRMLDIFGLDTADFERWGGSSKM